MANVPYHLLQTTATVKQKTGGVDAAGFTVYSDLGGDGTQTTPCHLQATSASEAQQWGKELSRSMVTMFMPAVETEPAIVLNPGSSTVTATYRSDTRTFRVVGAPIEQVGIGKAVVYVVLLEIDEMDGVSP